MMRCKRYVSLLTALFLTVPANAIELIRNGGFERFMAIDANNSNFFDWQFRGTPRHIHASTDAHTGTTAAAFGRVGGFDVIGQGFNSQPGALYTLSFWLKNVGSGQDGFSVSNGGPLFNIINAPSFEYRKYTIDFIADFGGTRISFFGRDDIGHFLLDDVSVTGEPGAAVPEPGTWAMLLGGFALIGAIARYRRRGTTAQTGLRQA